MFYIVDDFYDNPDEIREYALSRHFNSGRILNAVTQKVRKIMHPGARTRKILDMQNHLYLKNRLEKIVNQPIMNWYSEGKFNGTFNLGIGDKEPNWIHHDLTKSRRDLQNHQNYKLWAGVIYLTPNAPLDAGTSLWIRKEDGVKIRDDGVGKLPKQVPPVGWVKHASASNIYNRLVLYRGNHYHAPDRAGFGKNKETGRLTQLIVFMTE